ncbi:hypothetical protein NUW54_g13145 [Trametes sanguinea]|uniref:Uncharacterized protein n=1 Tax=Trametes sanguinea TaxID=158606 RepID=A0ACC1MNY9_9APHY|nr:hypothetical protein NUW54_g13145 [Trametes sanguinea]
MYNVSNTCAAAHLLRGKYPRSLALLDDIVLDVVVVVVLDVVVVVVATSKPVIVILASRGLRIASVLYDLLRILESLSRAPLGVLGLALILLRPRVLESCKLPQAGLFTGCRVELRLLLLASLSFPLRVLDSYLLALLFVRRPVEANVKTWMPGSVACACRVSAWWTGGRLKAISDGFLT